MWDNIVELLSKYPNAVLTGIDATGYPFSVRCIPTVDMKVEVLHIQALPGVQWQAGPANLLCHRHDELLWNLESFLLKGNLVQDEQGWNFHPSQFIAGTPGTGPGALIATIRWLRESRRRARQYLAKRNMRRPRVPWREIGGVKEEAVSVTSASSL
jgi:hypothetical protein